MTPHNWPDGYSDFNNEANELLEEQSPLDIVNKPEIVSFSEIVKWDTCPRQYYYSFVQNLSPVDQSESLSTGNKGHKLLQSFYTSLQEGKSKEEASLIVQHSAKKFLDSLHAIEIGPILKSWSLVDKYIRETDFNVEAALVENRFLLPASNFSDDPFLDNVLIGFTPDVVFRRKGGFYDVEDAKFVGKAWSKKKINRFPQAKLYQTFLRKMGYNVSRSSIRFFNTTTNQITQHNATLPATEEHILINDFMGAVREVLTYRRTLQEAKAYTRRTMNNNTCQFCFFEEICTTEAQGKNATQVIKYQFVKSDYNYAN